MTLRTGGPLLRRREALGAAWPLLVAALPGCGAQPPVEGGYVATHPERGHLLRGASAQGTPAVSRRTGVLIAGGGMAGLAAARALRLHGVEDFTILELEDEAGGNSRAGAVAGIACPLGAHYLPVPGDGARDVQDLLEELGLRRRVAGRWAYDERHLCHSPQERLYFRGEWQEGLLPVQGVPDATLTQYQRFAAAIAREQAQARYTVPASAAPLGARQRDLDGMTFAAWLAAHALDDAHLRWYLDYCCRDDYGAGLDAVSAWAGVHYFASRHGFHAPGPADARPGPREAVLTWPEGNGWLTRRLAQPLGDRLRTGQVVTRIAEGRPGVEVDCIDAASGRRERWQARHCVVALPAFVAARVTALPAPLLAHARQLRYAPWLVANVHLDAPLPDRPGAAPAWDNVVYGARGLGYVDASHQQLSPVRGPTVLSWYCAPGEAERAALLSRPWTVWRDALMAELAGPHPDLPARARRIEVARYGHAMAIPVPGSRTLVAAAAPVLAGARMSFAHADWAGYSVFEEAFTLGHRAGSRAAGKPH